MLVPLTDPHNPYSAMMLSIISDGQSHASSPYPARRRRRLASASRKPVGTVPDGDTSVGVPAELERGEPSRDW